MPYAWYKKNNSPIFSRKQLHSNGIHEADTSAAHLEYGEQRDRRQLVVHVVRHHAARAGGQQQHDEDGLLAHVVHQEPHDHVHGAEHEAYVYWHLERCRVHCVVADHLEEGNC